MVRRLAKWLGSVETCESTTALARIKKLEARQRELAAELEAAQPAVRPAPAAVAGRLKEWRQHLRSPVQARPS